MFLSLCVLHVQSCSAFDTRGKPHHRVAQIRILMDSQKSWDGLHAHRVAEPCEMVRDSCRHVGEHGNDRVRRGVVTGVYTRNRSTKLEHQREHAQGVTSVRKSTRKHERQHARAKQHTTAIQARLKNHTRTINVLWSDGSVTRDGVDGGHT